MVAVEVNGLGKVGVIRDQEGYEIAPEAFTLGLNMRFTNNGVERIGGREAIFGTPAAAPHFALPIESSSKVYWLYTSLTDGYVYDGSSHTNITRSAGGPYTTTETRQWNGLVFGGVPILNNGLDIPQYWNKLDPTVKLANLLNWPSGDRAMVMRSFGPYLIALNIQKGSTQYPHMFKWSHPADPGSLPISWDETDPTLDAGEYDLPDVNAGQILDGLPLQGRFFVYKENSVWRVTFIGGQFVFAFDTFLDSAGLLASRCVTLTGDGQKHVFATQDDIMVHDGNRAESILDQRFKVYLSTAIDQSNYKNSFMFTDSFRTECWFCYPQNGSVQPDKAIVWNYVNGTLYESDINFRNAATGLLDTPSQWFWNTIPGTWEDQRTAWSKSGRRRVVCCDTDETAFLELDSGPTFNGKLFTGTVQRVGLGLVGRTRSGEWIVDFTKQKLVSRMWIKGSGGTFQVRLGFQMLPDGPVTWTPIQTFNTDTDKYVDVITTLDTVASGKALAVEFSADGPFRVVGYKPEVKVLGL